MRNILFTFLLFSTVPLAYAHEIDDATGQHIRVGVWQNPPVLLQDQQGEWSGITIDVLRNLASQKGWQLEFVPGTFAEHLKNLQQHRIDLLSTIAYSDKRAERYSFTHNAVISNWGLIYTRPDAHIGSLLDLDNKLVAVMRNNIHDKAFRQLIAKFDIQPKLVELDSFSDVMKSIQSGQVEAGVANRLFGAINAEKYHVVETGIIFNPINIHYAAPHNTHRPILDAIDQHIINIKADKDSIYYRSLQKWMGLSSKASFPPWLIWLAAGLIGAIILMMGLALILRRQVAARTKELQIEVDERRIAQEHLDRLAYYDPLTGLPNRVSFAESIKTAVATARRRGSKVAVLFIDLDRFKTINDSLGHDAGDLLIVQVAKRLQACLREEDTINRFGGDEFVAILQDIQYPGDIEHVTNRMLKSLRTPINIGLTEFYTSVSIGVALFPDDGDSSDGLLKYADTAMYHAKAQGGNSYQFYNEEFTNKVKSRLELETRLRHVLERNELLLHYQPIFDLNTQTPVGVEALLRWQDPERGLVPPDEFIPFAEETGLIVPIGKWVIETACLQIKSWEQQGFSKLRLAVNISSRQFDHDKLLPTVQSALRNARLAPQQLELEITERMFLEITNPVRETLDQLKAAGVSLSIDDFGTGYSSLSYLKQLPIDTLKIDRSFVSNIPNDKGNAQIAATIVSMAKGLGLKVVAEGIETKDQLEILNSWGCHYAQGYYLARPQDVAQLTTWFTENLPKRSLQSAP